ncbi:WcaF family extracellular polysaccharide biosynthesis acetyltransferase [Algoriphagus sp. H41]|uniref:WcaF family extracellular polysaccharide biosynthesis acetyltransferase n=1 Tax=Algoriphagus oliviformis TaxID=2811231 RepID=A0ABS3CBD2_9BACT|nr:WcaF family extracellular polysaccharide biosynthesis acetyltransferase [Algoriphagus oliviformis]MBN7813451.1 WcaF family extracellular polysaccharide biosynthesis acetyltransferase [Algoriphagus oliviformis]
MHTRVKLADFDASIGLDRGATLIKELFWYFTKTFFFLSAFPFPSSFKAFLLRLFGARIGYGLVIKPRVNIHFPWKLVIGDHVWIGEEAFLLNFEPLTIGSNVCISQRAFLCGGNHDFRDPSMPYRNGPITLEDGSWVGASVFVGPNVTVGIDSVLAAGSVVSKDVPANAIFRGNPAIQVGIRWK